MLIMNDAGDIQSIPQHRDLLPYKGLLSLAWFLAYGPCEAFIARNLNIVTSRFPKSRCASLSMSPQP